MIPRRSSRVTRMIALARGEVVSVLLVAIAVAALAGASHWGFRYVVASADNARIAGLLAGRDVPVARDDAPEVLRARARFLLDRGAIDEAEALIEPITATGTPELVASFLHDLGDARMRAGFEAITRQDIDAAVPEIGLAKAAYRRALTLRPDQFATKVNLDMASRLVRDFPTPKQGDDEPEGKQKPRNLWTELPGVPEGLP